MGVLPYPGGILLYLSILLVCRVGGHCTGATLPPKTQKKTYLTRACMAEGPIHLGIAFGVQLW